jgi:hypothetical protein
MMQINTAKKRYEVGLSKLANTETSVSAMQVRVQLIQIVHALIAVLCNKVIEERPRSRCTAISARLLTLCSLVVTCRRS